MDVQIQKDAETKDVEAYDMAVLGGELDSPATLERAESSTAVDDSEPEEGVNVQELPPIDGGFRAWTFCLSAFILEMMVWGFGYSYGIFQDYYTSHPPFNSSSGVSIAAVGTVSLGLQFGQGILLSLAYGKYPDLIPSSMRVALVIYCGSLFGSSFATKTWQLILLQGVGVGLGGGMLYMPVIRLFPEWFSKRRGLAGGIIFSGTAVGGSVFPLILTSLLNKFGLPWTLRIWAAGTLLFSAIALFGIRSRLPVMKYNTSNKRPKFIPPQIGVLRNPLFLTLILTNFCQGLSYFPVSLYIATFTKRVSSQLTATAVLSVFNVSAFFGQIVLGHLSDRFPYPSIMVFCALGSAIGAFLLWGFASKAIYLYFFAIIFCGLNGGFSSTWFQSAPECVGNKPEYTGMAFSGMAFVKGISAVIGPIISGLLLEAGKGKAMSGGFGRFGYGAVEIFVGTCAVATGIGSVGVALTRHVRRA